jgi:transaldolase
MALFIDSSDPKEIKDLFAWGVLSGVTTNPLIIAKEAPDADLGERIREVLSVSTGDVSVELTTETENEMWEESQVYHAWDPKRITIKVPFSEVGLRVLHRLAKSGVKTNVTCLMAMNQAYLAALAGATYVSIFSGRVRDMGYDVRRHRSRGAVLEDHRRIDAPPDGRQRGARVRRSRADGHAAHSAQDGVESAYDRDDLGVQHGLARPTQEEVTSTTT